MKAFAGEDYETPVFEPEARRLLSRVEPIARHYAVKESAHPGGDAALEGEPTAGR